MAKVVTLNGQKVCWATHPDYPNRDGRARGRVWHLQHLDKTRFKYRATQCGMMIDEWVRPVDVSIAERRMCSVCVIQSDNWKKKNAGKDCCWMGDKSCPEHGVPASDRIEIAEVIQ